MICLVVDRLFISKRTIFAVCVISNVICCEIVARSASLLDCRENWPWGGRYSRCSGECT